MNPTISLLTDFGPGSVYVGQVHAVLRCEAPEATVVDLAHDCPAGRIDTAAWMLGRSWRLFPEGTVHLVVVDPGVGTERAILAAGAHGHLFVGPDNGVLDPVVEGGDVRRLTAREGLRPDPAPTFHGRDVMAPVAARLATGWPLARVGPRMVPQRLPSAIARDPAGATGHVLWVDAFGNLVTSLPRPLVAEIAASGDVRTRLGGVVLEGLARTFADVAPGRPLAYIGSGEHLEVAVHGGRADEVLGVGLGDPIRVEARTE